MAKRVARVDFTQSDDEQLTKFIAHVKPELSGRMGNNLYILLEQSADQRPWAKRHSWQSWRERYKKNQSWFNYQIMKYQKKKATPTISPEPVSSKGDYSSSSSSESKDEEDSEEDSESESEDREKLYTELFGISRLSEDSGDEILDVHPTKPTQPLQHIHEKPKRKVLPQNDDSNFFGTPSPSPSPPSADSTVKGKPPILLKGSYRNSLKRPRVTSGSVTNNESWPPKRRKTTAEEDLESLDVGDTCGKFEMKKAFSVTPLATGSVNGPIRRHPPAQQLNATASSSKVLLPDSPHRHSKWPKPTNLLKMIYANGAPSSEASHKLPSSFIQTVVNNTPKSAPNDGNAELQVTCIPPVNIDDPFIANRPLNKGKPDATPDPIKNLIFHDKPPRIDLRQSLNGTCRSSNISSHTSTSSTSSLNSVTPFLLPKDQELINQVGFPEVMAVIAKHYGFDVDVAMNAFLVTNSIENTKSVLQYAKEVTDSATSVFLADLMNQAQDDDVDSRSDEEPQSVWRGRSASSRKNQSENSGHQKAKRSSGSRKAKLSIKPRSFDEEIDQSILSDYSPPRVSRAGQFVRLVKQGRRKEAVDRERRRASGAFVAQTQIQSYEDQRQQSLSLLSNSSPTLNSGQEPMNIKSCNDDDSQPPVVTRHDDTVQHQPQDDVLLPVDHDHRIFFKRISEGQSTLNEDEDDPAMLKLAEEHRDLVMNVTEENADALRSFEQKNNQDLLRLWSLDWARQKIADM